MQSLPNASDQVAVRAYLIAQRAIHRAKRNYPWYDSVWLRKYCAAKEFIGHVRPERLDDFIQTFQPLRTRRDFSPQQLSQVFGRDRLADIRNRISEISLDALEGREINRFGRSLVHDLPPFVAIQMEIEPMVGEIVGEPVESSYNFLSLYSECGVCEPHMDSPRAKWTFDVCIDQSRPWPLYLSQVVDWPEAFPAPESNWRRTIVDDRTLEFAAFELDPGDAVVFSGSSQWHYREPLSRRTARDFCSLLFFHYLPRGMREVTRAKNWPKLFEIEELDWIVSAEQLDVA